MRAGAWFRCWKADTISRAWRPRRRPMWARLLLRDRPQIDVTSLYDLFALGLPIAHIEAVGNDSRAGLELFHQLGLEADVHVGQQIERHHRSVCDVGLEEVVLFECHLVGDAG